MFSLFLVCFCSFLVLFFFLLSTYSPSTLIVCSSGAHRLLNGCSSVAHYDITMISAAYRPNPSSFTPQLLHFLSSPHSTHALYNRTTCLVWACYTFSLSARPRHIVPAIRLCVQCHAGWLSFLPSVLQTVLLSDVLLFLSLFSCSIPAYCTLPPIHHSLVSSVHSASCQHFPAFHPLYSPTSLS